MFASVMYASAKVAKQPDHAGRAMSGQPYAEGSLIIAILLRRFQTEKTFLAGLDDTPAEKLWLLAAKGHL